MAKLKWDEQTKRLYESGVDRGVLYAQDPATGNYTKGVAWNGLTGVSESPEGGTIDTKYANNNVYLNLLSPEKHKGTIKAFTAPDEFAACDGTVGMVDEHGVEVKGLSVTGQVRTPFGMTYRTGVGNDTEGTGHAYVIHIIYNALAQVSTRDYNTINNSPEAMELSWEYNTTPIEIPGMKNPSAHLKIESRTATATGLKALEEALYGTDTDEAKLPTPEEVITLLGK